MIQSREQHEADLILAAEREAEAAKRAAREPSADEILLAQSDAEWAERDADDDLVMPPPVETAPPPPPPPAATRKPLPRPPKVRPPTWQETYTRGPYMTRKKREFFAATERPPLERLTGKVRPVAIPGRPTSFIIPERPPGLGPGEDNVVRSTKRARLP